MDEESSRNGRDPLRAKPRAVESNGGAGGGATSRQNWGLIKELSPSQEQGDLEMFAPQDFRLAVDQCGAVRLLSFPFLDEAACRNHLIPSHYWILVFERQITSIFNFITSEL